MKNISSLALRFVGDVKGNALYSNHNTLTARSELKMFKEGREALEHIENNHKGAR